MIGHRSGKRRRFAAVGVATALVAATFGFAGAPVGADDAPGIPDVPPLGFSIDPSQGVVGSTVNGQVDVDDIAANCITDPREFISQFVDPDNPTGTMTPYLEIALGFGNSLNPATADPALLLAAQVGAAFPIGIAADLLQPEPTGVADAAVQATMIMGFADLATASPIAPYGNFDPSTGVGSTPVPDIDGGSQVVIATCVGLPDELDPEAYAAAVEAGAEYIRENFDEPYPSFGSEEFNAVAADIAPAILVNLVEPMALGIATFCVEDGEGSCDEPENGEDPNGNGEEPNGNEPNGNGEGPDGNGNGNGPGGSGGGAQPATPVSGSPTYTG